MNLISKNQAVEILRQGGVVALPTETVYGLAGSIEIESALEQIFAIKARPLFDPLIVHVLDTNAAQKVCVGFGELHTALAEIFWPGPLTLVEEKSAGVSELITAGQNTVAVRSPSHPVFREILKGLGTPLAAPSANRFKRTSPTRAEHVVQEFAGKVPVVDGGESDVGLESTILKPEWANEHEIQVTLYRPGVITASQIASFLRDRFQKDVIVQRVGAAGQGVLPGQLKEHYQPSLPLILLLDENLDPRQAARGLGFNNPAELTLPEQIPLAARRLYSALRETSEVAGADSLVFRRPKWWDDELAEALRDRLGRASSYILPS